MTAPVAMVRVRCCGKMHRVAITAKGRVALLDHTEEVEAALALAGVTSCRCTEVRDAFFDAIYNGRLRYGDRLDVPRHNGRKGLTLPTEFRGVVVDALKKRELRRALKRAPDGRVAGKPLLACTNAEIYTRAQIIVSRYARQAEARLIAAGVPATAVAPNGSLFLEQLIYDSVRGRMGEHSTSLVCVVRALRQRHELPPNAVAVDRLGRVMLRWPVGYPRPPVGAA